MAGVVEAAVATMRSLGASEVSAALGPCIAPHAYRFSAPDLEPLAQRFGTGVVALDPDGFPALDVPATVRAALERAGATLVGDAGICTHCSPDHWSWRANGDKARQASVVWVPGGGEGAACGR
jgi:copper oxidase (laccase) domain-containing protein